MVQWLRLHALNAGGLGSIPGVGIKSSHAATKDPTCHKEDGRSCKLQLRLGAAAAAAAAKSLQSCPTLCDPVDGSPPGSPIPGILQARTLEWVAISFSNA